MKSLYPSLEFHLSGSSTQLSPGLDGEWDINSTNNYGVKIPEIKPIFTGTTTNKKYAICTLNAREHCSVILQYSISPNSSTQTFAPILERQIIIVTGALGTPILSYTREQTTLGGGFLSPSEPLYDDPVSGYPPVIDIPTNTLTVYHKPAFPGQGEILRTVIRGYYILL